MSTPKHHTITLTIENGWVKVDDPENVWKGVEIGDDVQFLSPNGEVEVRFTPTSASGKLPPASPTIMPFDQLIIKGGYYHTVLSLAGDWIGECEIKTPDGKLYKYKDGDGIHPCWTCMVAPVAHYGGKTFKQVPGALPAPKPPGTGTKKGY